MLANGCQRWCQRQTPRRQPSFVAIIAAKAREVRVKTSLSISGKILDKISLQLVGLLSQCCCNLVFPPTYCDNNDYVSTRLAIPPENIHLRVASGDSMRFGVYFDEATNKSLVRCDICQKFLALGATIPKTLKV